MFNCERKSLPKKHNLCCFWEKHSEDVNARELQFRKRKLCIIVLFTAVLVKLFDFVVLLEIFIGQTSININNRFTLSKCTAVITGMSHNPSELK